MASELEELLAYANRVVAEVDVAAFKSGDFTEAQASDGSDEE